VTPASPAGSETPSQLSAAPKPYPAYKDTGVSWLGDVHTHWGRQSLGSILTRTNARNRADLPLLSVVRDKGVILRSSMSDAENHNFVPYDLSSYRAVARDVPPSEAAGVTLKAGDVLMTEGGDIDKLGRGCVWRDEIPGCLHQNHVFAVRCRQEVLISEFLVGLLTSQHGRAYFQLTAKQTTNLASTNSTTLRAFPVVLPPVAEQLRILDEVVRQTSGVDAGIAQTENEIALLREYRTRLIADVVTGKLDMCEAAAALPEEVEEAEALDEREALLDGEEAEDGDANFALETGDNLATQMRHRFRAAMTYAFDMM
jgi:type I restriction enzyme S subunit